MPNVLTTDRVLAFRAALTRYLGHDCKIAVFRKGCLEAGIDFIDQGAVGAMSSMILSGDFDRLAYRYRIIYVGFPKSSGYESVFFGRKSLYKC